MRAPKTQGLRSYPGQPHHKKRRLRRKYSSGEWTHWAVSYTLLLKDPQAWDGWILAGGLSILEPYDLAGGGRANSYFLSVSRLPGPPPRARAEAERILAALTATPGVESAQMGEVVDAWRPARLPHPPPARAPIPAPLCHVEESSGPVGLVVGGGA